MANFFNSMVRGAGSELGRSVMRATVINPILKGSDSRPISISQAADPSKVTVLDADIIQTGSKNNSVLNWIFSLFFGFGLSILVPFVGYIISNSILSPRTIMTLDQSYYKADGRTKSGVRVNEDASVINVEVIEVAKNQKVLAAIHKVLFYINLAAMVFGLINVII
jgi:hypothetical protein